jgi:hypothetical protein
MILTFTRADGLLRASADEPIDASALATAASSRLVESRMNGRETVRFRAEFVTFGGSTVTCLEIGDEVQT